MQTNQYSKRNSLRFLVLFSKTCLVAALILLSNVSYSATKTWKLTGAGTWTTASNWVEGSVPAVGDDVIINCNGASNFSISSVPTLNSLNSLTIGGTGAGTVTLSGTGTLSVVNLYINNNLSITATMTLTTGTASAIATGKIMTVNSSYTLTTNSGSKLTVNGTLAVTGTLTANGTASVDCAGGGIVNFNSTSSQTVPGAGLNIRDGGTLVLSSSGGRTLSTSTTIAGKLSLQGTNSISGSAPTFNSTTGTLEYGGSTARTVGTEWTSLCCTTNPPHIIINNIGGVSLSSSRTIMGTLTLTGGALNFTGTGTLTFTGTTNPISRTSGTLNMATGTYFSFSPSTVPQTWSIPDNTFTSAPTITGLTVAMGAGGSLSLNNQDLSVTGTTTLTTGLLILGSGSLQVSSLSISSPGATKMIVTSATSGYLKRSFSTSSYQSFTYPIGENSGVAEYGGFSFSLNSNSLTRVIGFKVVDGNHPSLGSPSHYLSRYWSSSLSNTGGTYNYSVNLPYNGTTGDINGTESKIGVQYLDGVTWTGMAGTISTSSDYLSFSSVTQANAPLGYDIAGRSLDNDDPCGAITLTPGTAGAGCVNTVNGSTAGATQTYSGCSNYADDDVWYKFTATSTSHTVSVTGAVSFNPELQAYTLTSGTCPSATFTAVGSSCSYGAGNGGTQLMSLSGLSVGNVYYVRVYHTSSSLSATPFFTICVITPPANDEPCNAVSVVPATGCNSTNGDAAFASQTFGYATCDGGYTSTVRDVWYKFVASYTSHTIQAIGNGTYNPILQAYSGACGSLSAVSGACANSTSAGGTETVQMSGLTVGTTYHFRVYHASSTVPTNTTFSVCVLSPPANDEPCNGSTVTAVTLTPSYSCSGIAGDASLASQTYSYGSCDYSYTSVARDVWYRFQATDKSHTVVVTGNGTYNPVVTAYSGGSTCPVSLSSISGACVNATGAGGTENLQLAGLTIGSWYYVRVYHLSSTVPSNTTFTICVLRPPANDEPCSGSTVTAVTLTPGVTCSGVSGDAALASQTYSYGSCDYNYPSSIADVWYRFQATATKHYVIVTGNGTYNPVITAYSGGSTCPLSLSAISGACVNATGAGGTEMLQLSCTIGSWYYVRVYHPSSTPPSNTTFSICVIVPPANDDPCGAVSLSPVAQTCSSIGGDVTYASQSYSGCTGNADDDVWFKFTATASNHTVVVTGSGNSSTGFDAVVQAYTLTSGSCPSSAVFTAYSSSCTDATYKGGTETLNLTGLSAGTTYYIRVYDYYAYSSLTNTTFTICVIGPPANDEPCGAVALSPNTACNPVNGDAAYASQTFSGSSCGGTANNDVWYKFVATGPVHSVSVTGSSSFSPVVQAFYATSCGNILSSSNIQTCAYSFSSGGTASMQLTSLTAGYTYYLRVYDYYSGTPSTTTFSICVQSPPANDEPCGAVDLGTTTSTCNAINGDANLATQTMPYSICGWGVNPARDVWYRFTASGNSANIKVVSNGNFDAVIQAYTYSGSCPSLVLTAISGGCRQYFYGGTETLHLTGLTSGQVYYVRVYHGSSSLPSNTTFSICAVIPPSNDDCPGSNLTVDMGATAGTTLNSSQTLDSYYFTGYDDDDVWYNFTPSTSSAYIYVNGSGLDAVLNLRSANICPAANIQYRDFTSFGSAESMRVSGLIPGNNYKIRIFSWGQTQGNFTISVASSYTPSFNDNIENAVSVSTGTTTGNSNSQFGFQVGEPSGANWSYDVDYNPVVPCNSQWFVFNPTVSGCYTISSTLSGGLELAVYSASNASAVLSGSASEIASGGGTTQSTVTLSSLNLTAGTNYYIQVNGRFNNSGIPTITITDNNPVSAPTANPATMTGCDAFTANWTHTTNASGYRLDVSADNFNTFISGFNDLDVGYVNSYPVISLSVGNNYQYRVRAYGGCNGTPLTSSSNVINVVTDTLPGTPVFISGATDICEGQGSTYQFNATNATSIVYSISAGSGTIDPNTGVVVSALSNFTVRATAYNACGSSIADLNVSVHPFPSLSLTNDTTICLGTSLQLIASGASSYSWQPVNDLDDPSIATPIASPLTSVTYTVTGLTAGCPSTAEVSVTVNICDETWTGIANNDWHNPGNWSLNIVPMSAWGVLIPTSPIGGNVFPVINNTAYCNDISLEPGASITINSADTLYVSGEWQNSGQSDLGAGTICFNGLMQNITGSNTFGHIVITANTTLNMLSTGQNIKGILTCDGLLNTNSFLTLISDAGGTALISGKGNGNVTGTITQQRFIPALKAKGYKHFSSAFSDATLGQLSNFMTLHLGNPSSSPFPTVFKYSEADANPYFANGWVEAAPQGQINTLFETCRGYTVQLGGGTGNSITSYLKGTANSGNNSIAVTRNNPGSGKGDGWNLVGNPYPSPIDLDKLPFTAANITKSLSIYISTSMYNGYYGYYNATLHLPLNGGTRYLPALHAVFVQCNNTAGGILTFTNNMRSTEINPTLYKNSNITETELIKLIATNTANPDYTDETAVCFINDATDDFDAEYDAAKIRNTDHSIPNLFSITNGVEYAINSINFHSNNAEPIIPIGYSCGISGKHQIEASLLHLLHPDLKVYLEDMQLNYTHNLTNNPVYHFDYNAGEPEKGRFFLRLSHTESSVNDEGNETNLIYAYSSGQTVYLSCRPSSNRNGVAELFDIQGKKVFSAAGLTTGNYKWDVNCAPGVYVLKYFDENYSKIFKLHIQ